MKKEIENKFVNIKELIGNTPLIEIQYRFEKKLHKIYAKLEWYNLTGSIKDRVAYQILYDAYKNNIIDEESEICELTSGNMGISISAITSVLGNKTVILMPKNMSEERKNLIKLYGAELIEVNNFKEGFKKCKTLEKNGKFLAHQFENNSNIFVHYTTTGREITKKLKKRKIDAFVAGVGTGGTLCGIGKFLKENRKCLVVGIEPENARILSGKKPFLEHKIQGLSDEKLPKLYDKKLVDKIIQIKDDDAIAMAQKLSEKLGIGVGISSGANFLGCVMLNKDCATIFSDDSKKYLSTDLSKKQVNKLVEKIELLGYKVL